MSRANDRRFLFESGRFHSTLVEGGRYRATCMHYVYLNPVRAGIVKRAPKIFIRLGLEWFYRLCKEPWRIKRMMKLPVFYFGTWKYKLTRMKN